MKLFMAQIYNHLICSTHAFWQVSQYIGKVWSDHWLFSQFDSSRSIQWWFSNQVVNLADTIFSVKIHTKRDTYVYSYCIHSVSVLPLVLYFYSSAFLQFLCFFSIYYNSFHSNRKLLISIIWIFNYVSF